MTDTLTAGIPFDLTADELDVIADMAKDLASSSPRENAYQQIWYTIADKCQALAKALGSQLPEFEIARKERAQGASAMTDNTDKYKLHTPSGGVFKLEVETPLTPADREWMHTVVDLIVGIGDMESLTKSEIAPDEATQ